MPAIRDRISHMTVTEQKDGNDSNGSNVSRLARSKTLIAALLCICVLAAYGRTIGHDFLNYGDNALVAEDNNVQSGLSSTGVLRAFTNISNGWSPISWLSLQLDYNVYGLNPAGFHLTNVVIHALNSVLRYLEGES